MDRILILNSTYEPLSVVSWRRAIRMMFQDKVEIVAEYDREIRSVTMAIRLPSVLRLRRYVKHQRYHCQVKFSRSNLYARDRYRCQYCGRRGKPGELNIDHILPRSRGGESTWENVVVACVPCNRRKGDELPEEAGMVPMRRPQRPRWHPAVNLQLGGRIHPEWQPFLRLTQPGKG